MLASMGFVKRNDARQAQWLNGQLSDSNYYKGMAIDAAGSVATVWVGGQAGGVVLGKVGGGIVGHVISGAAAGGAGDAVTQTQQRLTYVATQGKTGQKQYSGKEFVTATAAGAVLGGAARAAGDVTINVGRDGVTLRTPNSTYGVRSPLYLDSSPGQLNSGIPVGVRSPLVKVGGNARPTPIFTSDGLQIPFGFKTEQEFLNFSRMLREGLPEGVEPVFQGSAVTGVKAVTSKGVSAGTPFDVDRISDFDIGLISEDLATQASLIDGVRVKTMPTRIGPFGADSPIGEQLGLGKLAARLSAQSGRNVFFVIYDSVEGAYSQPSLYVPN